MRIIAVTNQKGGVGKTTVAINISASLAREGRRVLLLDMDPQGHCAVGMAVPEEQIEVSVLDCLLSQMNGEPVDLSQATWQIAPSLDLAPSRLDLAELESLASGNAERHTLLHQLLQRVSSRYDFVVVDCPPQLGVSMRNALYAADEVIIPVETGYFSLHGLTRQLETTESFARTYGKSYRIRVLPNQYDVRTKLAREILAELRRKFGDLVMDAVVNFNTKLKEGASFGQPIVEFAPGSMGARDFRAVAREILDIASPPAPQEVVRQFADRIARDADRLLAAKAPPLRPAGSQPAEPVGARAVSRVEQLEGDAPVSEPTPLQPPAPVRPTDPQPVSHQRFDETIERIYGVRQTPEGVVFRSRLPNAQSVQLAGDFNNWMPHTTPMRRLDPSHTFEATLRLPPGRYRYRLVVDGRWAADPQNPIVEKNEYGEVNSVVEVS